jgi:hypothetical protein
MSLTVDISLAQVALITAQTSAVLRRLSNGDAPVIELADRIDRFLETRADTAEARDRAEDLVGAWSVFVASPRARQFLYAHDARRGIARQDQAVRRMTQLDEALRHHLDAAAVHPARATHAAA